LGIDFTWVELLLGSQKPSLNYERASDGNSRRSLVAHCRKDHQHQPLQGNQQNEDTNLEPCTCEAEIYQVYCHQLGECVYFEPGFFGSDVIGLSPNSFHGNRPSDRSNSQDFANFFPNPPNHWPKTGHFARERPHAVGNRLNITPSQFLSFSPEKPSGSRD
jgi:hypothetical protein